MAWGDHVETRSEFEAAELECINRVSDRLLTNERPDGDSHWASVVIDGAFEPRELTEAESVLLYESGLGIDVERMWIRPGVRKGPAATSEDTGEVTPYGEALPPLQDSERSRRAGLRGSGPRPQNVRIRMGEVAAENLADACRRASYRAEDRMADAELSDEKRAQAEADYESLSWASRWLVAEEARCLEGVTDPEWEREHVEGWTRLLERAERCLSCDPDAGSSYVVAHAIRASIAAGTRKDDASRIRPTDGPPRLLVEIVTAGGVQVGDVLLLDGECCEVTDRGSRIGFTLWFGRTPEAFELDQPVVRVLKGV